MPQTRKLKRPTDQRLAMLKNQVSDLLWKGRIETTYQKAKEVSRMAEKILTIAINSYEDMDGNEMFYITDTIRTDTLLILFIIFALLATIVSKKKGFFSLLAMAISFIVIFLFLLPQIATGKDPILIAILTSLVIIPITFYLSHGLQKKTTISILGTLIALVITGILSIIFVNLTKLSGGATEEALFLQGISGKL